jgi:GT2 family glycosyltransferase
MPIEGSSNSMISVIVPCFNEKRHIETCIRSLLGQIPPPGGMEVVVVDGLSSDGTRDILRNLAVRYPALRIVDNPGRVTPAGMNAGIREARGRYIAILGAHSRYEPDYLRTCTELLHEHPEAACVGGPIISMGRSLFGQAVAAAMSHPVGIGNARHRHPNYEGYAEGACYPVFRREVFDTIGFYDEALVRNQDDELNYRLTQRGGKVFLSPRARCTYFVRETVRTLFHQYFEYGYWRVAVLRKHRTPASLRQLAPPTFMAILMLSLILAVLLPGGWRLIALTVPALYLVTLFGAATLLLSRLGWRVGLLFPLAAATMHLAYAAGFLRGFGGSDAASVPPGPAPDKKTSSQPC